MWKNDFIDALKKLVLIWVRYKSENILLDQIKLNN